MKKIILAALASAAFANNAGAAVITQTWTGTVLTSANGSNLFGGGDLTGQSFTTVYVFDTDIGAANSAGESRASGGEDYNTASPNITASITILGITLSFSGVKFSDVDSLYQSNFSEAYSGASGTYQLDNRVYSFGYAPWGSLSFDFSGDVSGAAHNDGGFNSGSTQLTFANTSLTETQGNATASVPEPTSWAMFISGFGLIGGAMRRKRASVSVA